MHFQILKTQYSFSRGSSHKNFETNSENSLIPQRFTSLTLFLFKTHKIIQFEKIIHSASYIFPHSWPSILLWNSILTFGSTNMHGWQWTWKVKCSIPSNSWILNPAFTVVTLLMYKGQGLWCEFMNSNYEPNFTMCLMVTLGLTA